MYRQEIDENAKTLKLWVRRKRGNRKLNGMKPAPELFSHGLLLGPAPWVALVVRQRAEEASHLFRGNLELLSQLLQILIEPTCEGEEVIPLVLQSAADRLQAMRAFRRASPQLGHYKVVQFATVGVTRTGDRENVVAKPVDQQSNIAGQCHSFIAEGKGSVQVLCRAVC